MLQHSNRRLKQKITKNSNETIQFETGLDRFLLDQLRFFPSRWTTQKTQPACYNERTKRQKNLEQQEDELSNAT